MQCLNEALPHISPVKKKKKSVSFSTVEIREHAVILGDNPNCPLPLALDWKRTKRSVVVDIHHYEEIQQRWGRRRNKKPTRIDVYLRKIRLRKMGYSLRALNKAEQDFKSRSKRRVHSSRHQRRKWELAEF